MHPWKKKNYQKSLNGSVNHSNCCVVFVSPYRLCLFSAAWLQAATSAVACAVVVTAAVESVNHGHLKDRNRNSMSPLRT